MPLPEEFLRELHDRNDIIEVAQSYVDLKRSGSTFSCKCPFHSDSTPSCHFYPSTQSFFCFGCQAGGDVITFIRRIENLDYIDAVKFLAQRAGLEMPEEKADGSSRMRQRLYEMNRTAGRFWHQQLFSPEGAEGWQYITGRQLSEHTIRRFGLGWAANDYHKLQMYMRSQGFNDFELEDGSLLARYNNKLHDKFRYRLMFPIFDTRGNIIAFGGRTLSDDKKVPKYLNSNETLVFQKADNLFAMNYAKNSKADYFILCEGYMDVISMHQAGFDSAIASLGTAFTESQARFISRMGKKEVILAYDSDGPGQTAAARGINIFAKLGIQARVLKMDGAKDPDEFIKRYGAEAFRELIEKSGSAMDFEMDKLSAGLDLGTEEGRSQYLKKAVGFLAGISNTIDREVYMTRAARLSQVPVETVRYTVNGEINRRRKKAGKDEMRELIHPRMADKINPESYKTPKEEKAERGIICWLFHNPDKLSYIRQRFSGKFVTEFNGRVFSFIENCIDAGRAPDISIFNEVFSNDEMGRIVSIVSDPSFAFDLNVLDDFINTLNDYEDASGRKSYSDMSDDELLLQIQKLKEKKK
ncbi:MAG: DNA primase [Oscillospiraceae bacterium]